MKTKIFVVSELDYIYPYFYYTHEDAVRNAKARAVAANEPDWAEIYSIEVFWLGDEALKTTTGEQQ